MADGWLPPAGARHDCAGRPRHVLLQPWLVLGIISIVIRLTVSCYFFYFFCEC
jgi:hypothetical protein